MAALAPDHQKKWPRDGFYGFHAFRHATQNLSKMACSMIRRFHKPYRYV
jgi:hypothetical protein